MFAPRHRLGSVEQLDQEVRWVQGRSPGELFDGVAVVDVGDWT